MIHTDRFLFFGSFGDDAVVSKTFLFETILLLSAAAFDLPDIV
jgi:hypothetical protein